MKTQASLKMMAKLGLLLFGLGMFLAGCQTPQKDTEEAGSDKGHVMQGDMPMPKSQQSNVEQLGKGEIQIVIENFAFTPSDVTISPGTKVTWVNKDDAPHTATSTDKKFNSGGLDTDDKFSFVFNEKGEFSYICSLHPQMKATVKVK